MLSLLPVLPGTVSAEDKALLREAGFLVFEHPNPPELKVIGDGCDCDCGTLLGKLIAGVSAQIGELRPITLSVTAGPLLKMDSGPPVNADGSPVELHPVQVSKEAKHAGQLDYHNPSNAQRHLWVIGGVGVSVSKMTGSNVISTFTSSSGSFPVPSNSSNNFLRVLWASGPQNAPNIDWY
jgi:hypothetical protein